MPIMMIIGKVMMVMITVRLLIKTPVTTQFSRLVLRPPMKIALKPCVRP